MVLVTILNGVYKPTSNVTGGPTLHRKPWFIQLLVTILNEVYKPTYNVNGGPTLYHKPWFFQLLVYLVVGQLNA